MQEEIKEIAGKYWVNFEEKFKEDEEKFIRNLKVWLKNQADMCGSVLESMEYLDDIREIEKIRGDK